MEMANDRKRDGGIAAPGWWTTGAAAKRKDQGIRIEDMAELVAKRLGVEAVDPSRISRCLSGTTSTIPLLEAISAVLGMEPPVFVAESPSEAREIASVQRTARERDRMLAEADRKIADLKASAPRQTQAVKPGHGAEEGRAARGAGGRGRGAGAS